MTWDKVLTDNTEISDLYEDKYRNDSSVTKLATYDQVPDASEYVPLKNPFGSRAISTISGGVGAHRARKKMREAGMSEQEINAHLTRKGGAARGLGKRFIYGDLLPYVGHAGLELFDNKVMGGKMDDTTFNNISDLMEIAGSGYSAVRAYKDEMKRGKRAINAHKKRIKELKDGLREGMQTEKKADYGDAAVMFGGPQSIVGGIGAHRARKEMREAGMSEQEINAVSTRKGGMARGLGRGFGYGFALPVAAYETAKHLGKNEQEASNMLGYAVLGGQALGGIRAYRGEKARGRRAIEAYKKKKGSEKANMSKEAGLFMRPSDIADHTNLARALEDKLNGVSAETQFKTAGISNSQYAGATIGGVAGYGAHKRAQNREVRDLAPEEVKGVRGKLRKVVNKAQKAQTRFAKESPKTSATVHSIAGGVAGATVGAPASKTVSRILRRR